MYELYHYGIKRRSGRYPFGSGDRPYQSLDKKAKKYVKRLNDEFNRRMNSKDDTIFLYFEDKPLKKNQLNNLRSEKADVVSRFTNDPYEKDANRIYASFYDNDIKKYAKYFNEMKYKVDYLLKENVRIAGYKEIFDFYLNKELMPLKDRMKEYREDISKWNFVDENDKPYKDDDPRKLDIVKKFENLELDHLQKRYSETNNINEEFKNFNMHMKDKFDTDFAWYENHPELQKHLIKKGYGGVIDIQDIFTESATLPMIVFDKDKNADLIKVYDRTINKYIYGGK